MAVEPSFLHASESPESYKTQIIRTPSYPLTQISDWLGLDWGLRICISNKFLSDAAAAAAAGPEKNPLTTLGYGASLTLMYLWIPRACS